MIYQQIEYWVNLSREEQIKVILIFILTFIIALILEVIKITYEEKVLKSNSKFLKFVFKHIL